MNEIVIWSPFEALELADSFFSPRSIEEIDPWVARIWDTWEPVTFRPSGLEIYEEKDELIVKADLPGVKKEDFKVHLEDDVLSIEAEKKREETSEDAKHYTSGRYYGKYAHSVKLPFPVAADKVAAKLDDGVLEIRLPKAEEAKPKQIEVK